MEETNQPEGQEQPSQSPESATPSMGFESRIDLSALHAAVAQIKQELHKIIVGQDDMIDMMLIALLSDGHVLLEGVPGVAKTLVTKLMAKTMSVHFSRIQFTSDLMPSDVIGTSVFNQKVADFDFRRGPIFSNFVLIDEVNRAPAKTQAALFEAMEERQITVDGTTYYLEPPFIVFATQNPVEQEGTYRLPEAQLDRFMFKINVDYPSVAEEENILRTFHDKKNVVDLDAVAAVLTAKDIADYRSKTAQVFVEDKLFAYISSIVHSTRDHQALYLGASPRASLAILSGAKASAAIGGRDFITPDDIKRVVPSVLKHRIVLTPEKEMEGVSPEEVIQQILMGIEVPR